VDPDRDEDREEWGEVQVSAILESDGSVVGSQPSLGSIYIFQANEDTVLSFIFNKAFYRSKRSPYVNVTSDLGNPYLIEPRIILNKIRNSDGTTGFLHRTTESVFRTVSYEPGSEALRQSQEALRKELEDQAELARISKSTDIFQFNLEVYDDVYRNTEPLQNEVVKFKSDTRFLDVTKAPEGRAEVYKKIVQRDRGENVEIDSEALIKIANDTSLAPTVRVQSIRAMTVKSIGSVQDKETLDLLRRNSREPSSKLYASSLTQLLKIGEPADKAEILRGLEGRDVQRAVSVMNAIDRSKSIEGKEAVRKLAVRTDVQPAVKELARQRVSRVNQPIGERKETRPDVKPPDRPPREVQPEAKDRRVAATTRPLVFTDEIKGASGTFTLFPSTDGTSYIRVDFSSLGVSKRRYYVLWAMTPEKRFVRLGQLALGRARTGQIEAKILLRQFGLILTAEMADNGPRPAGPIISTLKIP